MAGSLNKVMIIGNLGANPELKNLPSGQAVTELRIATNEVFTDKNQQKQERVEWHRVTVWGKQAENCVQYLAKGRQVYVEGRLQTDTWDDKETGQKRYALKIIATNVQFLGGLGEGRGEGRAQAGGGVPSTSASPAGGGAPGGPRRDEAPPDFGAPGGGSDDIPF